MNRLFVLVVAALVWVQQGSAINPDALKALLNPALVPHGSILGERCAIYEDALRKGPWGEDFANLSGPELLQSVLEYKGDGSLHHSNAVMTLSDIRDCLKPQPTFDDKASQWRSGHAIGAGLVIKPKALKQLLKPKLRSWYKSAQERCAVYEEVMRSGPSKEDIRFLDSYQLMEVILYSGNKSYPLTGLDAVPIREDIRRCIHPDKTPEPKQYDLSHNKAPKGRPQRRAAIMPDALKRLLDLKLRGSTVGERCVAYEESLRNEPEGGEFANLTRYELLRSILSSRRSNNLQNKPDGLLEIVEDVKKCLFTSRTYEFGLANLERWGHHLMLTDYPLDRKCNIVDGQVQGVMDIGDPLYLARKADRVKQAIMDLEDFGLGNDSFALILKECVNKLPEFQV